jgi:hypothetical protein
MKNPKPKKPFHLHIEHFFRKRYILIGMLALLFLAIIKADAKTLSAMREASAHSYGVIGEYMREETSRVPVTFEIAARHATYSGR